MKFFSIFPRSGVLSILVVLLYSFLPCLVSEKNGGVVELKVPGTIPAGRPSVSLIDRLSIWYQVLEKTKITDRKTNPLPAETWKQLMDDTGEDGMALFEAPSSRGTSSPTPTRLKKISNIAALCEASNDENQKKGGAVLKNLLAEFKLEGKKFLQSNTVYSCLQQDTPPDQMVENWFKFIFFYHDHLDQLAPFFSVSYRKKILFEYLEPELPFKGRPWCLVELFSYYHDHHLNKEIDIVGGPELKIAQPLVDTGTGSRRVEMIFHGDRRVAFTWKLEAGAWRFDQVENLTKPELLPPQGF